MSIYNDDAFAKEVIENTAKIVARQKIEFMKELHAERSARQALELKVGELTEKCTALETRLNVLQSEKSAHKCQDVLRNIFSSSLMEVVGLGESVPVPDNTVDQDVLIAIPNPESSENPTPGPSGVQRRKSEEDAKRKKKRKSSPVRRPLAQTLDDVPTPLRESIAPFVESKMNDYLNDIQRALVVYRTQTAMSTNEKIGDAFINAVIKEGIANSLWYADFNPSDKGSFFLYLKDKVHNIRRKINRRLSVDTQQELIDRYVKDFNADLDITGEALDDEDMA